MIAIRHLGLHLGPALIAWFALTGWAAAEDVAAPYVRFGGGTAFSHDTRFSDKDCTSMAPAALFGCGTGADGRPFGAYGDFGRSLLMEGALGYMFSDWARGEVIVGYRPTLAFDGRANFANVPLDQQPVDADVTSLTAMVEAIFSPAPLLDLGDLPVQPFVSAAAGVAHNETNRMVYEFPSLGVGAATVTQGGDSTDFAWALGGGIDVPIGDGVAVSLAYRYVDLGYMRTDPGPIRVTRPSGVTLIPVGETRARLTVDEVVLSIRTTF